MTRWKLGHGERGIAPLTTSAAIAGFVLEDFEIVYLSDTGEIVFGDGVTPGGRERMALPERVVQRLAAKA